jgi:hypothetical protein
MMNGSVGSERQMALAVSSYTRTRYTCSTWVLSGRLMVLIQSFEGYSVSSDGSWNAALFAYSYVHYKPVE